MPVLALPALVLSGAVFGFFYAWVCSTMWGLDALPPEMAMAAMQAMNASVRNAVSAPAFFGTGPVLLMTAAWAWGRGNDRAAALFAAAGAVYLLGAFLPTAMVNVPMNEALARVDPGGAGAAEVWAAYSPRWQAWNIARTIAAGLAVALAGLAMAALSDQGRGGGAKDGIARRLGQRDKQKELPDRHAHQACQRHKQVTARCPGDQQ